MKDENILNMTALEVARAIRSGDITSPQATEAVLSAIEEKDGELNGYIRVFGDRAIARASEVQKQIERGALDYPLAGVPYAIKDNICTEGIPTTCGSKMLENFIPPYSATVVHDLERAGAVSVGKLNLDEFCMGSTSETSFFGPVKNPWDTTRVPGGSSGGAAASVAARMSFYAYGSDTGGSIRQPCSYCGVSGIKPTYGSVSRFGLIAYASSLDQIGPIGRDMLDCAAALNQIIGKDPADQTTIDTVPIDLSAASEFSGKGLRIGVPEDFFAEGIDPEVEAAVRKAVHVFSELGASVTSFRLPIARYAIPTYYIIACAEACSNLSRYDGIKYGYRSQNAKSLSDIYVMSRSEGFGLEVKRRIMLGNYVLSSGFYDAYYKKALQSKALIRKAFDEAFVKYDLILGPTAPSTAPRIGESLSDPLRMYLSDVYTVLPNIVGLPSASIPCGFDRNNMPVGLQMIGPYRSEQTMVGAACLFQRSTAYHLRFPEKRGEDA
ncbi:MAG: Asp-tRNA(Asn)/Glu-tRNA(Gln) amidotransferase subunit GatA [Clostridiaceae bacterium]|nr:Asp-tRNA(Asn)/Glu-tRNA(Gln) amidotransferase subunit GatA [Clostridiaceae bacterium]